MPRAIVLTTVVLYIFFALVQAIPFAGFTDDPCRSDDDCVGDRRCERQSGTSPPEPCLDPFNQQSCSCFPKQFLSCEKSTDCPSGERCRMRNDGSGARCTSCTAFFTEQDSTAVDEPTCPDPSPTPQPLGLTADPCTGDNPAFCRGSRSCTTFRDGMIIACGPGEKNCDCQPLESSRCNTSADCTGGERCTGQGFKSDVKLCQSCVVAKINIHAFRFIDNATTCDLPPAVEPTPPGDPAKRHCPKSPGLTFDTCCSGDNSCAFPRSCVSLRTGRTCATQEVGCVCIGGGPRQCENSARCEEGERCVQISNLRGCMSCNRIARTTLFPPMDDGMDRCEGAASPTPIRTPVGPTPVDSTGDGPSGEERTVEPSAGAEWSGEPSLGASSGGDETRNPSVTAGASSGGTAQTILPSASATAIPSAPGVAPVSAAASPSSQESEAVCVGVRHLKKLSQESLVFGEHRIGRVLCDANESCATAGHMVMWQGVAMVMRRYCMETGGCVEREMLVNSPRVRRGLRVKSETEGLLFTALAARWESRMEEVALRAVVRAGW